MDTQINRAPLRAPFTVCLWLTDYCNLDCAYCYAKPFSGRRMETERTLRLIDEFIELGVFDLTLAGGEPTLHPAVLDIVRHSVEGGLRVGLLSNGVSLSDRTIARLEETTTRRNFLLQISLDSAVAGVNDMARGKGTRVLCTLERLRRTKLEIQIACVLHKQNISTAHTIIDAYYPDIKRFHFLNIQRTREAMARPDLLIDESEALEFWLRLNEHAQKFPPDLFLPSLRIQLRTLGRAEVDPEASLHRQASFDCLSCSAGWTHVNINTEFEVLGCDIAKDYTQMGNCRTQRFQEVWHSEQANLVRQAPYPACYKIESNTGRKLENYLKPKYAALGKV
jgi:MoaA/NifB/PqqE/SkfB family radical SAM enzyme